MNLATKLIEKVNESSMSNLDVKKQELMKDPEFKKCLKALQDCAKSKNISAEELKLIMK